MAGQHWDNPTLLQQLRDRTPQKETILQVLQRIEQTALNRHEFILTGGQEVDYETILADEFHRELEKLNV